MADRIVVLGQGSYGSWHSLRINSVKWFVSPDAYFASC